MIVDYKEKVGNQERSQATSLSLTPLPIPVLAILYIVAIFPLSRPLLATIFQKPSAADPIHTQLGVHKPHARFLTKFPNIA